MKMMRQVLKKKNKTLTQKMGVNIIEENVKSNVIDVTSFIPADSVTMNKSTRVNLTRKRTIRLNVMRFRGSNVFLVNMFNLFLISVRIVE